MLSSRAIAFEWWTL